MFFCSVLYGNPSGPAAGTTQKAWTIATSGVFNLSSAFCTTPATSPSSPCYSFTVTSLTQGQRVYTPAGSGASSVSAVGLAAPFTLYNYQQNLDPVLLTTAGFTYSLASSVTQPGATGTVSSITLAFSSSANLYVEKGAETPLYSSFQYFPLGPGTPATFDNSTRPPCSAVSTGSSGLLANPQSSTLLFGFCYQLSSPQGMPTSGWHVSASGFLAVVAGPAPDVFNTNSPYQVYNLYNIVGQRSITLGDGSSFTSNIIALEPDYEGVADGGPDNALFAVNSAYAPQWFQNAIPGNDNGDGVIWGPTYLDGNGFTYNMYPPSPIAGSQYGNSSGTSFPTFQATDVNFYWNSNYREVNEPKHQDPQGLFNFQIQLYNASIPFLSNIPTCQLQARQWSFCYILWGNPTGSLGPWAVATSGILTTDAGTPTAQLNPSSLYGPYGFANYLYRVINMTGTRTFTSGGGAVSSSSISGFYGNGNYYAPGQKPFYNEPPFLYDYVQNGAGYSVNTYGLTYFTSSASAFATGPANSTVTIAFNNVTNTYWELNTAPTQYSYFQYVPVGSPDVIPSCTAYSNSAVTVWQFCYTVFAPQGSINGPWSVAASGLLLTTSTTQPQLVNITTTPAPYLVVAITGYRHVITGAGVQSNASILALEPVNRLASALYYSTGPLPDGGPDNLYFLPSANYSGGVQLDGNGLTYNLYPPTLLFGNGALPAQYTISDVNFYHSDESYREVNEPIHQEFTGVNNFTVSPYTKGTNINTCVAPTTASSSSGGTIPFSFCYLAYSTASSATGPWSTAVSGVITVSSTEQFAPPTVAGTNPLLYFNILSITGTRTYISNTNSPSVTSITAPGSGRLYYYIHNNSETNQQQDSRALDVNGLTYNTATESRLPGLTVSYDDINLAFSNGQFVESGTTGSGFKQAEVPGLSSFSYALLGVGQVPACYPQTANNVQTGVNVAVASFCYQLSSPAGDPSGPWSITSSGFLILNSTQHPDTFSSPPEGNVYTITSVLGTRSFFNGSGNSTVNIVGLEPFSGGDGGPDNELFINAPYLDGNGYSYNVWPPALVGSGYGQGYPLYYTPVSDIDFYFNGQYREVNEPFHEAVNPTNTFSYSILPLGQQVSVANLPTCQPAPLVSTGTLCIILYSLPGNVDYPWSVATSLTITYNPVAVTSKGRSAVLVLSGTGTRTFTNRFGKSFSTNVTVTPAGTVYDGFASDNLLFLNSPIPFDGSGLTLSLASGVQQPGHGPTVNYTSINLYNSSGVILESHSSRVDPLGSAFVSSVPGFQDVTIGASDINTLGPNYATCSAPITFTNGKRPATEATLFDGAKAFFYSYFITDGISYSVSANLTLNASSPYASTVDQLGNPYQTIIGISGVRHYTYLPTGAKITSIVSGLSLAAYAFADQRWYPYSLLNSVPGVYTLNTAPFVDYDGIEFGLNPSVPLNGYAPGNGTLYNATSVYIESPESEAVLTEGYFTVLPNPNLQQQFYKLIPAT